MCDQRVASIPQQKDTLVDFHDFPPIAAVLQFAYSVVSGLADLVTPIAGASSAALAIVLITVAIRITLIPVGRSQVRADAARRRIAPQVEALRKRHARNPEALQRGLAELYTRENASPFAGILPTLVQAPIVSTVYGLFVLSTIAGHANELMAGHLFGVTLGSSVVSSVGTARDPMSVVVMLVPLAVLLVVAWLSRQANLQYSQAWRATVMPIERHTSWLVFTTVVVGVFVPFAALLYLTVSTTWATVERSLMRRRYLPT